MWESGTDPINSSAKPRRKKKKKKRPKASASAPSSADADSGYFAGASATPGDSAPSGYESAQIMSKRFVQRGEVKNKLLSSRDSQQRRARDSRKQSQLQWQSKMEKSPFLVDLLAENERIEEENRIRIREETRRAKSLDKRKVKVKNVIILKALQEASDLDALRAEKRMIILEERRLKACYFPFYHHCHCS